MCAISISNLRFDFQHAVARYYITEHFRIWYVISGVTR